MEPALARIISWVEAGRVTVAEAVPGPLSTTAYPPEALRSATTFPAPETVIAWAAADVVDDDVVVAAFAVDAVAAALVAAAAGTPITAALEVRRAVPTISASDVSAGTVGAFPDIASDSEARTLVTALVMDALAAAGGATVAVGGLTARGMARAGAAAGTVVLTCGAAAGPDDEAAEGGATENSVAAEDTTVAAEDTTGDPDGEVNADGRA